MCDHDEQGRPLDPVEVKDASGEWRRVRMMDVKVGDTIRTKGFIGKVTSEPYADEHGVWGVEAEVEVECVA